MLYDLEEIGKRLKGLRMDAGMTQEHAANKLSMTRRQYGRMERGERGTSIDMYILIADMFHVSLDYILLGKSEHRELMEQHIRTMSETLMQMEKLL